jgi:endoribonuclease Dicer
LEDLKLLEADCFQKASLRGRYTTAINSLGLLGADEYLHSHLVTLIQQLNHSLQRQQRYQKFGFTAAQNPVEMDNDTLISSILQIETILEEHSRQHLIDPNHLSSHASPKLRALIDILRKHWKSSTGSFQGIVFVSQRHIATSLCWILKRHPDCTTWLRPAALMGHGNEEASSVAKGMTIKEQNVVRQQFKSRTCNLR